MTSAVVPAPLDRILPAVIDDLRSTLGNDLIGVYLYGSAVSGGFDPELSDLDLVVVTAPAVDAIEFRVFAGPVERLQAREPDWAGLLDIVFIGRETLAGFRAGGPFLEISHEEPLRLVRSADEWLETWFLAREADRALVGPPIADLIPPIDLESSCPRSSRASMRSSPRFEMTGRTTRSRIAS